ncbi:hypothetical protein WQ57_23765 [Mesobacillus campisalis]|uniref:Uncharacterized protein n=1 Tax=Mesobacillus campisalis TaxID=1408103 RepID=A0A0M2SH63_9BACI|nr:hypothetical protein [Mesobacillus campisalis]KKK33633.1 hypothetical protein WQ57_23765 [Mesobacillus campisalis]
MKVLVHQFNKSSLSRLLLFMTFICGVCFSIIIGKKQFGRLGADFTLKETVCRPSQSDQFNQSFD